MERLGQMTKDSYLESKDSVISSRTELLNAPGSEIPSKPDRLLNTFQKKNKNVKSPSRPVPDRAFLNPVLGPKHDKRDQM